MNTLPAPTEQEFKYKMTAHTYEQVCAAIEEINAANAALIDACVRFEEMFKARYFSKMGPYLVTDKSKIDADYAAMAKAREYANNLEEPGFGGNYRRRGGSLETYPIVKWGTLTKQYKTATAKLRKYL